MKNREKSIDNFRTALEVMPGGVNSPVRAFGGLDLSPIIVERGAGALIYDLDGYEYIDFCMSWGALILGHAYPSVVAAAQRQMALGSSYGTTTSLEQALARKVISHFPSIEKIRFVSSGTEATMSAVKLARGYTGRSQVLKFNGHYHGHAELNALSIRFNDLELARQIIRREHLAAVILEPIGGNMGVVPPIPGFLEMLREETEKRGTLLIFDEVITGFRVALGGAQALYKIKPDLTCLGKIVGGGFPAAAYGGKREIMEALAPLGPIYQAGTLSGNPVAMAAGLQTLTEIERPGFYEALQRKADIFFEPIEQGDFDFSIQRVGSMFSFFFGPDKVTCYEDLAELDHSRFKAFFHHLFQNGVYLSPSPYEVSFLSSAHTGLEHPRMIEHLLNGSFS